MLTVSDVFPAPLSLMTQSLQVNMYLLTGQTEISCQISDCLG